MNKNWWLPILLVLIAGGAGIMYMGIKTYQDAPPIPNYRSPAGATVISSAAITRGQLIFQKYALMDYGSMFGDGAGRGPDFTAEALHHVAVAMRDRYLRADLRDTSSSSSDRYHVAAVESRVRSELKTNSYDPASNSVAMTDGQFAAYESLVLYYTNFFHGTGPTPFSPARYITDTNEIRDLTSFFFWGSWVCSVQRPGKEYSYTHNWPYDEAAGNKATSQNIFWSLFGVFGFVLGLGGVLYLYGRTGKSMAFQRTDRSRPVLTIGLLKDFTPSPTQRGTYRFFATAMALMLVQVLAGVLTIHDFVGFTSFFGVDLAKWLPITITRGWHVQMSVLWISLCWIGASIFILPMITKQEPTGQRGLISTLYWTLIVVTLGSTLGQFLGPMGFLGEHWNSLGNQGWEFVELGRLWQVLLFVSFALWGLIVYRGLRPILHSGQPWSLPHWLFYSIAAVLVFFCAGFVGTPSTNFVVADFWRWMTIHMWVEAFFEVFTTIIVAYFMYLMGLATQNGAARVVYLSAMLFLGSGILGVAHNFYWNAKPEITLALGSVFSTMQAIPLVILTLEAWKLRASPATALRLAGSKERSPFGQSGAFLFLLAVNFWNFMGAGVFGAIINLPIVNYYEHGTYLTVNHGHAALMGVYGNLSIGAVIFCARYLLGGERWNERLVRMAFWSINIGLSLMVLLDLFPAGLLQFSAAVSEGLWYARSAEFIQSSGFQGLTWMRMLGGAIFLLGGVIPLAWFILSRFRHRRAGVALVAATEADPVEEMEFMEV